ncbi:MAG: hypothetical protein NVV73_00465 [Cellvibrionaceae bacterium]|nr:hypothetical protein [Cellvibrionaceae bacterium]
MDEYKFEMKGRAFDKSDRLDKLAAGLTPNQVSARSFIRQTCCGNSGDVNCGIGMARFA